MERKEILVTVKTAPTASRSYFETVCTAGVTKEGELIRIYPVEFRMLDGEKRYRKYDWISVDVEPRDAKSDIRKESHRCDSGSIRILGNVPVGVDWDERRKLCIDSQKVYTRISELVTDSDIGKPGFISLAVFKPKLIRKVLVEDRNIEDDVQRQQEIKQLREMDMFNGEDYRAFCQARPMDAIFRYEFLDDDDTVHRYMIEDWELYELYRAYQNKQQACQNVKKKYESFINNNDVYFFLGTRLQDHRKNRPGAWSIIGVFYPPKNHQLTLF